MQALRLTRKLKELKVVEVPVPKICTPEDVLVKVAYGGVCGTDLHILSVVLQNLYIYKYYTIYAPTYSFRCFEIIDYL